MPVEIGHERTVALGDDRLQSIARHVVVPQVVVDSLCAQRLDRITRCKASDALGQVKRTHPLPVNDVPIGVLGHGETPLPDIVACLVLPAHAAFDHGHSSKPSSLAASVGTGSSHQKSSRFS